MKSNKSKVMVTGLGPLIIRSAGVFSKVLIRFKYDLTGDNRVNEKRMMHSGKTIGNIYASDLILFASKMISRMAIQVLTKPVYRCLALISSLLRFVKATVSGICMAYHLMVLGQRKGSGYFNITNPGLLPLNALQSFPAT